jgi:hypothetical protein
VGSKGCLVYVRNDLRWRRSSLLLLTNNKNIEIFMHLATRKNLHCDMRNIAFRKTNDTHELGMQIEKDLEWSEPKTTPKWHTTHKDTSTH